MFNGTLHAGGRNAFKPLSLLVIASAAMIVSTAVIPTTADAHDISISSHGLTFGDKDNDLLQQLIDLDADEIEDLRQELVDARSDIEESIDDIADARTETREGGGAKAILDIAFNFASSTVSASSEKAFKEAKSEIDHAARQLDEMKTKISSEEYEETKYAIDMLRTELAELEKMLGQLADAFDA